MFGPSKMTRTLAIALLAIGLAGGSACSSDGSEGGSDKTTTTTENGKADNSTEASVGSETSQPVEPDPDGIDPTEGESEGASENEQDYVDELSAAISSDGIATVEQGQCIGTSWIELIGFDAIVAVDMSPSEFGNLDNERYVALDLGGDVAGQIYDTFEDCDLDFPGIFRELSTPPDATDAEKACVAEVLSDDAMRTVFIESLIETGGDEDFDPVFEEVEACFTFTP